MTERRKFPGCGAAGGRRRGARRAERQGGAADGGGAGGAVGAGGKSGRAACGACDVRGGLRVRRDSVRGHLTPRCCLAYAFFAGPWSKRIAAASSEPEKDLVREERGEAKKKAMAAHYVDKKGNPSKKGRAGAIKKETGGAQAKGTCFRFQRLRRSGRPPRFQRLRRSGRPPGRAADGGGAWRTGRAERALLVVQLTRRCLAVFLLCFSQAAKALARTRPGQVSPRRRARRTGRAERAGCCCGCCAAAATGPAHAQHC